MADYLDCPCRVFAPSLDDDDIISAYDRALAESAAGGYTPLLIVPDDTLLEAVTMAVDEDSDMDFAITKVRAWRKDAFVAADGLDAAALLRSEEELSKELTGKINMKKAERRDRFSALWNSGHPAGDSGTLAKQCHTYEVILAFLPTSKPWEAAIYVPMGGFNDCPGPQQQAAVMKYWYERHGAVPGLCTYDEWEFCAQPILPADADAAVLTAEQRETLQQLAAEQYCFCTDRIEQYRGAGYTLGDLAACLAVSSHWYFWWD